MGVRDGEHPIRSGAVKIRFAHRDGGRAPGSAQLLDLRVAGEATAEANLFGAKTRVKA